MIEGLHFDVEFEEMREHLLKRVDYHNDLMIWYSTRGINLRVECNVSDRQQGKQQEGRRDLFQFLADHLIKDETYRLSESYLRTLEFIIDTSKKLFL